MKKENLPIIIAIALPILFIIIASALIFVPSILVDPQHNFIYTSDTTYSKYENIYTVVDGKISIKQNPYIDEYSKVSIYDVPKIYLYNVEDDTSKEISLEEAQKFDLDPGPSSPDGFYINYEYGHNGIFEIFGDSGNNRGWYITKGNAEKKIDAIHNERSYYYSNDFELIGWIK